MQKIQFCILFLLFSFLIQPVVYAQNEAPSHSANGEHIKEWLLLGPFSPDSLNQDFLADVGGEGNIEPKEGDIVITATGDTLVWKRYRSNRDIVDLLSAVGDCQNAVAYAFCTLKSDIDGKHQVLLGSDDGVAVWINGKRVHYNPVYRPLYLDNDAFETDLKPGSNRCLVKVSQGTLGWGFAMRVIPHNQPVKVRPKFYLLPDHLKDDIILSFVQWRYKPGDNPEWANPDFDDSSWELVNPTLRPDEIPKSGWQDIGWFRFHVAVDSSLLNKPLGLSIWQAGVSQLYLDGTLLHTFGKNTEERGPKTISFDGKRDHVIAVSYTNPSLKKFHRAGYNAGFFLRFGNMNRMAEDKIRMESTLTGYQMFFTALPLAIGLLHLILFFFFPTLKQNLHFAVFLFLYAATVFFDYQNSLAPDIGRQFFFFRVHLVMYAFFLMFQLRFVYSLFYVKLPKQFRLISAVIICFGLLALYKPLPNNVLLGILNAAILWEIGRVIVTAFLHKKDGTWIIGLAFFVFIIFGVIDALMDTGVIILFREMSNPYAFGIIGFIIAMSVYLSRDFARTNKKLIEQKTEQRLLEVENARQAKELEDARQLQLSMLPKELPKLPNLEIDVYMKTATEVGGDYYDFKQHENASLTVVIGDATGHGMQAGTMVSATKSLFHALADEPSPVKFLQKGTKALNAMGLKKMYMALTIAKIKDHNMLVAAAGMPFPLIFRFSTGAVDEVVLKGMPLGGVANFPYKEEKINLEKGDTILFASDGFEEMFNPQDEILGGEQVKKLFAEITGRNHNPS